MWEIFTTSPRYSLLLLLLLTFLYFLENLDRYLIAVSPIPYIDYSSYEYSILAGPAFTVIYAVGGLFFALGYFEKSQPDPASHDHSLDNAGEETTAAKNSSSASPHSSSGRSGKEAKSNKATKSRQSWLSKEMVLTLATCTFSAAFTCTALATSFYQQCIIRVVMGFAQSVITPFSTSLIRDHFAPEVSGAAFGIFNVGTYVAFSLSLSLGIYIYLTFGWQAGYLLFGMVGMAAGFFLPCLTCFKHRIAGPPVPKYQHLVDEDEDEGAPDNGLYGVKRVSEREGGKKEVEDFQRYYPSTYNIMAPRANPMLSNTIPIQNSVRGKAPSMSQDPHNNASQSFPPSLQSPPTNNNNNEYMAASSAAVSISDGLDDDDEDFLRVSIHSPMSVKRSIQQHQEEYGEGVMSSPFISFPEDSPGRLIQDQDPYASMNNMYAFPVSSSFNNQGSNIMGGGISSSSFNNQGNSIMGAGIAQSYDSQRSLSTIASNNNTPLPPVSNKPSFSASHTYSSAPPTTNAPTSSIPRNTSSQSLSMKSDFSSQHSTNFIPRSVLQPYSSRLIGEHHAPPSNRSSFANSSLSTIDVDEILTNTKDETFGDKGYGDDASSINTFSRYTEKMEKLSVLGRIGFHLHQIMVESWWKHNPSILLLCLATGIRIGGGYIWSAYTGVYFSDMFSYEADSISCTYSYNTDLASLPNDMCTSDFPYCVSGSCATLTDYPWHNEGMDPLKIESFMSWVPLVGSALGSVIGGLISDRLIQLDKKRSLSLSSISSIGSQGSHGNIASLLANSKKVFAMNGFTALRSLICGVSTLASIPLVMLSFYLDFPGCFLIYIASGVIGEVYLSQSIALVTDPQVIPRYLVTASVALFTLMLSIIGGNTPLLVPILMDYVGYDDQVTLHFSAASNTLNDQDQRIDVSYDVLHDDARKLQYSMMFSLILCYLVSGCLYVLTYFLMLRRSKYAQYLRQQGLAGDQKLDH